MYFYIVKGECLGYCFFIISHLVRMQVNMRVSCSPKTARNIIKKAGPNSDMLIKSVLEFQKTSEELDSLLENFMSRLVY